MCRFFSVVNITVPNDLWWVESTDMELQNQGIQPHIGSANYNLKVDFLLYGGSAPPSPTLFKGQLYIINSNDLIEYSSLLSLVPSYHSYTQV